MDKDEQQARVQAALENTFNEILQIVTGSTTRTFEHQRIFNAVSRAIQHQLTPAQQPQAGNGQASEELQAAVAAGQGSAPAGRRPYVPPAAPQVATGADHT